MDKIVTTDNSKVRRKNAGTKKLDKAYQWPIGFGTSIAGDTLKSMPNIPKNPILSDNDIASLRSVRVEHSPTKFGSSRQENIRRPSKVVEVNVNKSICSSTSKGSTISKLQQKENDLETEKLRQEIYKLKGQLKVMELENEVKLLKLDEHISSRQSIVSQYEDDEVEVSPMKRTNEWVSNVMPVPDDYHPAVDGEKSSDIKVLCHTIADAIKAVSMTPRQDKFITRQVIEKDYPYFDGNPEEWPIFISQFKRISTICDHSPEEKLIKLQKCLKGEAKLAVSGMMVSPENIDLVLKTLEMRFGRPDQIIEKLILRIKTFPQIKEQQMETLIHFANHVSCLVATIKSLDYEEHLYNPQVLKDMVQKIPDMIKLRWGEEVIKKGGKVNLNDFSKWINDLAQAACYVSTPKNEKDPIVGKIKYRMTPSRRNETTLVAADNKKLVCVYCEKGNHKIRECQKLKEDNVDTRWEVVTNNKLCFSCLRNNHQTAKCKIKYSCGINGCKRFHNKFLHKDEPVKPESTLSTAFSEDESPDTTENVLALGNGAKNVLLRMVNVKIYGRNHNKFLETVALCDEASTVTLIDKSIVDELGLQGQNKSLCLQWTNNMTSQHEDSKCVDIHISGIFENAKTFSIKGAHTVNNLSLPLQIIEKKDWQQYSHLKDIHFNEIRQRPMILLGQDNIGLTVARKVIQGLNDKPLVTKTNLGWILHGPLDTNKYEERRQYSFHICKHHLRDEELHQLVKQSFTSDACGISSGKSNINHMESRAMEIMKTTAKYIGDRYEIGLLWKADNLILPESKTVAIQRLKCVERKMLQDDQLRQEYSKKIESYLEKGYARILSAEESRVEGPKCWYLPHFPVFNPNKPNKLRLVFDAASKSHGTSLNECLLTGPDLLQPLVEVLLKFRQRKVAFCADVREMFHQICIRHEDQSSQRFLWRNGEINRPWDIYEMKVMTFGACSPTCAQFIKNLNARDHTARQDILDAIIKKHYVDDYLDCADSDEEALERIIEVRNIQKIGGFELVNWFSNSSGVMKALSEKEEFCKDLNMDNNTVQRVLGLFWNSKLDYFCFKWKINKEDINKELRPTKRQVLKLAMSVFDPLGLVVNLTVRGRILIQDIWKSGIGWDDSIDSELYEFWILWLEDLKLLTEVEIPRCYSLKITANHIELHTFCDASKRAFASAVYIRLVTDTDINVALVIAKARVAPTKQISIPRLELQAALMGSRLVQTVRKSLEFEIKRTFMWTDSTTVLYWIKNDACKLRQFEAPRIGEIQELTNRSDWFWIPSKLNVADLATRTYDKENSVMKHFARWFQGPEFLLNRDETTWPQKKLEGQEEEVLTKEIQCTTIVFQKRLYLPDINRFSKWIYLIGATARVLKFTKILISRKNKLNILKDLEVKDLEEAEIEWIKQSQEDCFAPEIECLKKGKQIRRQSKLRKLMPIRNDNGLLVLNGRIDLAPDVVTILRKPIILPSKHRYTQLLLQRYHEQFAHQGLETVVNEVRQKFWVINMRSTIKSVFAKCQWCKVKKAKPEIPVMGQLPVFRLTPNVRPFTFTGIDYFGPLYVTVGRHTEKRWGVIFTCLSIRAVHLEVAHSLNTDSAIMAIKRMMSRRGRPKEIYTDNGTNFRGASEELRRFVKEIDQSKLKEDLRANEIDWKFIPPGAPHMGGVWERLVRSVKSTFHVILKDQKLKDELLLTLFAESENIVNSRPLTKVSVDPNDLEVLTPNNLLIGETNNDTLFGECTNLDLRFQWKRSQHLIESFWKRWTKEYLPTLTKRTKWTDDKGNLAENDIVIIIDDNVPKKSWRLGRVQTVFPGPDGRVRVAEIKTMNGILKRPVTKLCRIDVKSV